MLIQVCGFRSGGEEALLEPMSSENETAVVDAAGGKGGRIRISLFSPLKSQVRHCDGIRTTGKEITTHTDTIKPWERKGREKKRISK